MDWLPSKPQQHRGPPVPHPQVPPPTGRHVCRHPRLHGVVVWTGTLAWVGVALWWGLPLWLRLSRLVPPVLGLLAMVGLALVWISLIMPASIAMVYTALLNHCDRRPPPPSPSGPPPPPSRRIRRVILSPEAAWQRFGIRGKVILEEEEQEEP